MLDPKLLEALYGLGAEIVLTATDARKVEYSLTFAGQREPLALTLPPGHYVFLRVPHAPGDAPGLAGVSSPNAPAKGKGPVRAICPECDGAGRVALPGGDDGDCEACGGSGQSSRENQT